MNSASSNSEPAAPLTPAVFHILLALAEGERHGYAIMMSVAETTDHRIRLGPGTLYGTIKRLLAARLIEESDRRPDLELDDERRRYYRLTAAGERHLQVELQRLDRIVKHAKSRRLIRGPAWLSGNLEATGSRLISEFRTGEIRA